MQQATYSPLRFYNAGDGQFGLVDERRKAYENSLTDKWHCVRTILYEQYLWDMRCWEKPKSQYSKEEVKRQIAKWINDHNNGNWTYNCGHCVYCIRILLSLKWATLDEVTNLVLRNNYIKYPEEIGTWNSEITEKGEVVL